MTRHFVTVAAAAALITLAGCDGGKPQANNGGGDQVTVNSTAPKPSVVMFDKIVPAIRGLFGDAPTKVNPALPVRRRVPPAFVTPRIEPTAAVGQPVAPARAAIERAELTRRAAP